MFGQRSIENAVSGNVERYQRATIRQRFDNELIEAEQDAVVCKMRIAREIRSDAEVLPPKRCVL